MTDIVLDEGSDGTFIVLDGRVVKATATDLMLDSPGRRIGPEPFRRALVHDVGDSLTMNFGFDYPGGIKLNGVTEVTPLRPHSSPDRAVRLSDPTPVLTVHGKITFEHHRRTIEGVEVQTFDLVSELYKLQSQITALQAQVAALGATP